MLEYNVCKYTKCFWQTIRYPNLGKYSGDLSKNLYIIMVLKHSKFNENIFKSGALSVLLKTHTNFIISNKTPPHIIMIFLRKSQFFFKQYLQEVVKWLRWNAHNWNCIFVEHKLARYVWNHKGFMYFSID